MRASAPRLAALGKALTYALLSLWAAVCLFPFYWLAVTSIKSGKDIERTATYVPFVDFSPSLDAWRFILGDPYDNLVPRFLNSLIVAVLSTAIAVTAGGMAIYGLTRFRPALRWFSLAAVGAAATIAAGAGFFASTGLAPLLLVGAGLLLCLAFGSRRSGPVVGTFGAMSFMLATRVLPPVVLALPLYMMARVTGTLDTVAALVLVYAAINLPVAVWLLQPVLGARATDQEESAQLDGASHLGIFFTILLPMVRAGVAAAGILIFLLCWNEYLFAAYLTSDAALTLPPWMVGQLSFREAQVGGGPEEWARLSAAAILMAVPALVFATLAQRLLSHEAVSRSSPNFFRT